MWRFIARRLMWAVFLFVAVTFITYVIFFVAPNDPAKLAAGKAATAEQVKQVAEYLNLDEPVWKQYGLWMKQLVFEQSLGRSFVNRQDVNDDHHQSRRPSPHRSSSAAPSSGCSCRSRSASSRRSGRGRCSTGAR